MKTLAQILTQQAPLSVDQQRDLRGRLRYAGVDVEAVADGDTPVVLAAIASIRAATPPQMRTAAVAGQSCPRCQRATQSIRLSESEPAIYCEACKIVTPV